MSDSILVKVDNWGIYFLQRLKHFFNRTDYCDLTLQFQDNAQLKVHRLVLSACTEYFELLERTCEMYEDCLVMPDDLQADVVVPIINFMYTGQLEFRIDLLEKLYQTALILNIPILTKLLDSHRSQQKQPPAKPAFTTSNSYYGKRYSKLTKTIPVPANSSNKRSYSSAFDNIESQGETPKKKSATELFSKAECIVKNGKTPSYQFPVFSEKNKRMAKEPRPTRYELPEELDEENIFDNSFTNISYGSKPLMVHPETTKQYGPKRIHLFEESTSSGRFIRSTPSDIVECRKISGNEGIFVDAVGDSIQDDCSFQPTTNIKDDTKNTSQLFDQILENNTSKITIETKNNMQTHNIDHAKIISEVLKKYPHLVKSNKNIKLKILNTAKNKKSQPSNSSTDEKPKNETPDFTYESDVINSKEAARLIALGAENVAGPWICLICGTPGKALHFTSYFNFRKHLVEVHNEKPVPSICEFCGVKSQKRNYIVHHKLTKHGVPAPPAYTFPKCNHCSYIALNEALLVKHKATHSDKCFKYNPMSVALKSGQKYSNSTVTGDRKNNLQCIYCLRIFLREHNLYAHLKINHKEAAKNDGIIDDSEEEQEDEKFSPKLKLNNETSNLIKVEVPVTFEPPFEDVNEQYQIEQKPDGSIHVLSKKPRVMLPSNRNKILNLGFSSPHQSVSSMTHSQKIDSAQHASFKRNEFLQNTYISHSRPISSEDTVIIDNKEYFLQDNQLVPKKEKISGEYVVSHASNDSEIQSMIPTTSVEYHNIHNSNSEQKILVKKSTHTTQPLQIVVSNEEEYKTLLSSNQSVIYDEGETSKTISEFGGPNNISLDTGAIDLDTTHSNDMMIIPDFPMSVPETISADNSNIVVVYSHPVEDQNKQYSLITTQGLEGEFVQSSAIIAQNYETVTTCTPVVTTHTVIENSWQNNAQANMNKLTITPSAELQTVNIDESITITPGESLPSNSLSELPEVQLTTAEPVTIEITQAETNLNTLDQSNIITTISQQCENISVCQENTIITLADTTVLSSLPLAPQQTQIQSLSSTNLEQTVTSITPFDQDPSTNTLEEPKVSTSDKVDLNCHQLKSSELNSIIVEDTLHENEAGTSSTGIDAVNVAETNASCDSIIEDVPMSNTLISSDKNVDEPEPTTNVATVSEELNDEGIKLQEDVKQPSIEETIENVGNDIEINSNNHTQCAIDPSTNEVTLNKIAKEQIETLTSEWSEEECDVTLAEQSNTSNANLETKNEDTAESGDIEESIENIQKELEKQVSGSSNPEPEDITDPSQNDSPSIELQADTKDNEIEKADSHEKISSLLNDWDDNDSQEDDTAVVNEIEKNAQSSSSVNQNDTMSTINNTDDTTDKPETNKNNIKSLVSDWDEEDEDENKN